MSEEMPDPKFRPLILGALPHESISEKTGLPITQGIVQFTIPAQKHAFKRHPDNFHMCLPFLAKAVSEPTYAGQAPHHKGSAFEVVLEVPTLGMNVMLAVTLRASNKGVYFAKSVYPVDNNKISRRLRKGHLFRL